MDFCETYPSVGAAWTAVVDACRPALARGVRPVVLVRDYAAVLDARRALADTDAGFGVEVATVWGLAQRLWALHGDDRSPVDPALRQTLLARLARERLGAKATAGVRSLLARLAREALCSADAAAGLAGDEPLVADVLNAYAADLRKRALLEECEVYDGLVRLAGAGEVPLAGAYDVLAFDLCDAGLTVAQERFLTALGARRFESDCTLPDAPAAGARDPELEALLRMLYRRGADDMPVTPAGALRLAFAAGPAAEDALVLQAVSSLADELSVRSEEARGAAEPGNVALGASGTTVEATASGAAAAPALAEVAVDALATPTIVVALPDPLGWLGFARESLVRAGVAVQAQGRRAFENTQAGAALLALAQLAGGAPEVAPDVLLAADFALNPFAGMWFGTAFYADKMHRGNRLVEGYEVLSDLAGHADPSLQGVIGLLEEGEADAALDLLAAFAASHASGDAAWLAEQQAAIQAARVMAAAAQACDLPWHEAFALLEGSSVSVRVEGDAALATAQVDGCAAPAPQRSAEPAQPRAVVRIMTLADAAALSAGSADALVVARLDAASQPVRDTQDAAATLLAKWGAAPQTDELGRARRTFARALAVPRRSVVLERMLHTAEADEAQPALVFEEAIACYRESLTENTGLDRATRVPHALAQAALSAGEQHLVANATGALAPASRTLPAPQAGAVSPAARPLIVLPRLYGKQTFPGLDLSASQIESYLECPYQWFAKRRLRLERLEEGFGPAERGTFVHAVLQEFHERFSMSVAPKVTPEALPQARAIMEEAFAQVAAEQPERRPGERYAPANAWEREKLVGLLPVLRDAYLPFEAALLPGFAPHAHEWGYGEVVPYSYAGCNICGRIDRIDMDAQGRAVVIDYKSSLSSAYRLPAPPEGEGEEDGAEDIPAPTFPLPRKVQALMYAKVVRDTLGVPVVGALYVNPLKQQVVGAFDAHELGPQDIPFASAADAEGSRVPWAGLETIDELIDAVEHEVSARMEGLAAGDVAPAPSGDEACAYCPVGNCPNRLVGRKS